MLEIPSGCCGLARAPPPLLFHPSILHPSPLCVLVYIWSAPDKADVASPLGSPSPPFRLPLFFFFCTSHLPPLSYSFILSWLSEGGRQSHVTAGVEGLETGFYTSGNGVKRDNSLIYRITELIWGRGRARPASTGRVSKRKDTLERNCQDVRVQEKQEWWCVNRVWMIRARRKELKLFIKGAWSCVTRNIYR